MLNFIKNFFVAALFTALIVSAVGGALFGVISLFYWLSAGALWGLPCAIIAIISMFVGIAFACSEVRQ